jgi:hypothetical protein
MSDFVEAETIHNVPAIADDSLIRIARDAEARIEAVIKIKQLALKVTNPRDWSDQNGNPYLQVSGSEKIANLFNISWGFLTPEPLYEEDPDGHYTYTFKGRFSMGGRSIEVEGSRSSKDSFFKQNIYEDGKLLREKKVEERDNKRDVKMAALTNLLGNGITRLLGIRNLTWEDLEAFAGIKKDQVGKVDYKNKGKDRPPVQEPQKKGDGAKKEDDQTVTTTVVNVESKTGEKDGKPYTLYGITGEGDIVYKTFSETFADIASTAKNTGDSVTITYKTGKFGNTITGLVIVEREPGQDG